MLGQVPQDFEARILDPGLFFFCLLIFAANAVCIGGQGA
jgi:hypothetical protein